ncbi:hypothetical protein VTJ83DRAFT_1055 [Remersonia thermophila]|uniref:Serine-rich protein n=1 Tax=Remersonia thermophila TaxID=72144 RepID=A0ABR4DNJ3_9PEZI
MSAPTTRHGSSTPVPSNPDRSSLGSQTSKPGIRLVRYSPPRLSDADERAASQASSREHAASRSSNYSDKLPSGRSSWRDDRTESRASTVQGSSALPSPMSPGFSLAKPRDDQVSGVKPLASPSIVSPSITSPTSATPSSIHLRSPSDVSSASSSVTEPRRSRPTEISTNPNAASQRTRSQSRRRLRLAVHSNGTFSLVPDDSLSDPRDSVGGSSLTSPLTPTASRTPSAQDRPSLDTWSDRGRRASTPLTRSSTTILDPCDTPESQASSSSSTAHPPEDASSASPWSYRLVGGVRKVPPTPEKKGKRRAYSLSESSSETQLAPLREAPSPTNEDEHEGEQDGTPTRTVLPKPSFVSDLSAQTVETVDETANYKVYGPASSAQGSNDSLAFHRESTSNWEVLGPSSPAPAPSSGPPSTHTGSGDDGDNNYVIHAASESPSSSLATVIVKKPRPSYSHESLLAAAPLRPTKRRSNERFGYYKQRSRETLRSRTNSLQSVYSQTSSLVSSQEPSTTAAPHRHTWTIPEQPSSRPTSPSEPSGPTSPRLPAPMLRSHPPAQWSSNLSTVMSESEPGSDPARSVSPLSESTGTGTGTGPGHHRRRSSIGWVSSLHSRQMPSISSSIPIAEHDDDSNETNASLERPQPALTRAGGPSSQIRMVVRDQDEHGDGLADLDHRLDHRPSRSGLSALFSSGSNGSNWNLHSNASSRANSLTSSAFPAWARVYYGSGERRFLGRRPSFLTLSDKGSESRPPSSCGVPRSDSPASENFPQAIYSPRKRPREVHQHHHQQFGTTATVTANRASVEIRPVQPSQSHLHQHPHEHGVFRTLREKTSSIWSPHLYTDRRATRYSVWDPPSVNWAADRGLFGRRNAQVVLFLVGFIMPLAWMIAAFLPLPHNPNSPKSVEEGAAAEDSEKDSPIHQRTSRHQRNRTRAMDETRYESARWWRNLNRAMSVVGLLLIGAVVALAVVGARQGWGE